MVATQALTTRDRHTHRGCLNARFTRDAGAAHFRPNGDREALMCVVK